MLTILGKQASGQAVSEVDWRHLFSTQGYVRLKAREAGLRRAFTDADFTAFVRSDTLTARASTLRRTLAEWETADVGGAADRALAYLPSDARIAATVYVVIKPQANSFVYDVLTDPAIFLYLDPQLTKAQFENTVAHELHHIGFAGVGARADSTHAALPDSVRLAAQWLGALGEGFAMLAAAGGPDIHPHASSATADRFRWDKDLENFNRDLGLLDKFFMDILSRRLGNPDTVRAVAATFYGIQGPWYTVGWKMAVTIEARFGRSELIRCMTDPHRLLDRYNAAAADYNRAHPDTLAQWSRQLVNALQPVTPPGRGSRDSQD